MVPDQRLVVVITGGLPGERFSVPEELTVEYVLPAILSDDPLPPAANAQARLATAIAQAGSAPEPTEIVMPPIATAVDGVRYEFRPNDWGYVAFRIDFGAETGLFELEYVGGMMQLETGLDGRYVLSRDPGGELTALRGTWTSDDTLIVEVRTLGEAQRPTWKVVFDDSTAQMVMSDSSDERILVHYTADRVE